MFSWLITGPCAVDVTRFILNRIDRMRLGLFLETMFIGFVGVCVTRPL